MSDDYKDDIARLHLRIHEMETALEKMKINLAALTGIAESCEYYMDLAVARGKQIDRMAADRWRDVGREVPPKLQERLSAESRCTYLMRQEDLDD